MYESNLYRANTGAWAFPFGIGRRLWETVFSVVIVDDGSDPQYEKRFLNAADMRGYSIAT